MIIGGGFAGMALARHLKRADVDVSLIDSRNHHLFQPLIYQVAAGALSSGEVAAPIREMVRRQDNVTVLMATATDVDLDRRQVVLDRRERLDYDSLIVACGAETSYFGHDEWRHDSYALKTLEDAVALRNGIFTAFEEAERASEPAGRTEWLTFAVVGGGPTGVEIAGQLAVLSRQAMRRDFRRIDPRQARVILLDAGDRVVSTFSEPTSAWTAEQLAGIGVTVRERALVTRIDPHGVTLRVGDREERIDSRTVIWAAGVRAAGVAGVLARAAGAATDRGGQVKVNPDLTLPGHPEVSVIGDAASARGSDGHPLPGLATVAIQQARHVADGIRRGRPGAAQRFRYFDKGTLAVVGRGRAVCEVRGHRLHGLIAFLMYLAVHLYYLDGVGGRRITVLSTWISAGFGARQNRVIAGELAGVEPGERPPQPVATSAR